MAGLFDGTPLERPVTCEVCGRAADRCTCPRGEDGRPVRPADQHPRVRREKRRGKFVTVIAGLDAGEADLKTMAAALRSRFATGGTVRAGEIEVQGDHADEIVAMLIEQGYRAKRAGG